MTLTKFLLKLVLFSSSVVVIAWLVINHNMPPDYQNYMAAWIDKTRLLDNTPSPRIILVGGSSLAFGVDSAMLSDAVGMPVINVGLHAGLGLDVILNDVKPRIRTNDTLILIPEYFFFQDNINPTGDIPTLAMFLDINPLAVFSFGSPQLERLPDILAALLKIRFDRWEALRKANFDDQLYDKLTRNPAYSRSSFNALGDAVGHLDLPPVDLSANNQPFLGFRKGNSRTIQLLTQFGAAAQRKGAQVLFFFPFGRQTNCELTSTAFQKLYPYLVDTLPFTIVSTPLNNCIGDQYFYDTFYHLNAEGREIRSKRMAAELKFLLDKLDDPLARPRETYSALDFAKLNDFWSWYQESLKAAPSELADPNQIALRLAGYIIKNPPEIQVLYHTGDKQIAILLKSGSMSDPSIPEREIRVDFVKEGAIWKIEWVGY